MQIPARLAKGLLIAIEGVDGAGKTTQVERLYEHFRHSGLDVVRTKEPTDGPHGRRIRASAQTGRLPPQEELDAFVADRRQHVAELIEPALEAGKIVIVDRYFFSTAAYQGARGLDFEEILELNRSFAPEPHLLVILEVPAEVGVGRVRSRGDHPNLFEEIEYLNNCAKLFQRLTPGDRVARIDATADADSVHKQIVRRVRPILRLHAGDGGSWTPALLG